MQPPAVDELEITVMGNGYGECIALHYGNGDWLVVDSFLSFENKRPIAKDYLETLGVDVSTQVKYICVTHADSDHIKGIGDLYVDAKKAVIIFSEALNFTQFVSIATSASTSGFSTENESEEFHKLFEEIKSRRSIKSQSETLWLASSSQCIFQDALTPPDSNKITRELWGLSPSVETKLKAQKDIEAHYATLVSPVKGKPRPATKIPRLKNNHTSVVLWLTVNDRDIILGADLEELNDPSCGWQNVVGLAGRPKRKAEFFKIPHHGSVNAHYQNVWEEMIDNVNISATTTYSKARSPLPTQDDITRIARLSGRGYVIGSSTAIRNTLGRQVDRILQRIGKNLSNTRGYNGRVTFRSKINDGAKNWTVHPEGHIQEMVSVALDSN